MTDDCPLSHLKIELTDEPKKIGIILHDCPDPDCIGAAYGMRRLIKSWNSEHTFTLIYGGTVSHPQNKTMINVLNIVLTHIKDIENIDEICDTFIAVDCVPERTVCSDKEFIYTVDHHKSDTQKSKYKDIRNVGSCSSIVYEYLESEGIHLDANEEDDSQIATSMLIGIKTDTNELTSENTTDLDWESSKKLMECVNQRNLRSIINYPIPPYHFDLRKKLDMEGNVVQENGFFIGGIGYISPSKRDALPTLAEERSRVEGIDTAFIFAIVGSNIEVSIRSNGISFDVNTLCQKIFGKEHAGGKTGAGAARIPMGFLNVSDEDDDVQEKMWEAVKAFVVSRITEIMAEHR